MPSTGVAPSVESSGALAAAAPVAPGMPAFDAQLRRRRQRRLRPASGHTRRHRAGPRHAMGEPVLPGLRSLRQPTPADARGPGPAARQRAVRRVRGDLRRDELGRPDRPVRPPRGPLDGDASSPLFGVGRQPPVHRRLAQPTTRPAAGTATTSSSAPRSSTTIPSSASGPTPTTCRSTSSTRTRSAGRAPAPWRSSATTMLLGQPARHDLLRPVRCRPAVRRDAAGRPRRSQPAARGRARTSSPKRTTTLSDFPPGPARPLGIPRRLGRRRRTRRSVWTASRTPSSRRTPFETGDLRVLARASRSRRPTRGSTQIGRSPDVPAPVPELRRSPDARHQPHGRRRRQRPRRRALVRSSRTPERAGASHQQGDLRARLGESLDGQRCAGRQGQPRSRLHRVERGHLPVHPDAGAASCSTRQDTMPQPEGELMTGGGSQLHPAARWGDYSSISLDPRDDCTFWFTSEYMAETSDADWHTRIASFKFPSCTTGPRGTVDGTVTTSPAGDPLAGAQIEVGGLSTVTDATGHYAILVPADTYSVSASSYGFRRETVDGVVVGDGATVTRRLRARPAARNRRQRDGHRCRPGLAALRAHRRGRGADRSALHRPDDRRRTRSRCSRRPTTRSRSTALVGSYVQQTRPVDGSHSDGDRGLRSRRRPDTLCRARLSARCRGPVRNVPGPGQAGRLAEHRLLTGRRSAGRWRFDDPAGRGNLTGGEGDSAIIDTDWLGPDFTPGRRALDVATST